jgi:hypothetical protein
VYGPVRTVVWEDGGANNPASYPILGERYLLHVLREYAMHYFNDARPHQGLDRRIPVAGDRVPLRRGVRGSTRTVHGPGQQTPHGGQPSPGNAPA